MNTVMAFVQQNFAIMCLIAGLIVGIMLTRAVRIGLKLLEIGDRADGIFKLMEDIEQRWRSLGSDLWKAREAIDEMKRAQYYMDKVNDLERKIRALENEK